MNGILLINKPENITSFNTIDRIRKKHKLKKIGHAGTIDSFASGLLIAGIGEGTKLLPYLTDRQKEYVATFYLGRSTDTLDPTGEIIYKHDGALPEIEAIEAALSSFVGEIFQVPPRFSAVKIRGERSSDLARRGMAPDLDERPVTVYSAAIIAFDPPLLQVTVRCSKGTYIRSLARDLGQKLGCGSYVSALVRTLTDPYSVDSAYSLEELLNRPRIDDVIIPLEKSLPFLPSLELSDRDRDDLVQGKVLPVGDNVECMMYMALAGHKMFGILKVAEQDGVRLGTTERIVWA